MTDEYVLEEDGTVTFRLLIRDGVATTLERLPYAGTGWWICTGKYGAVTT